MIYLHKQLFQDDYLLRSLKLAFPLADFAQSKDNAKICYKDKIDSAKLMFQIKDHISVWWANQIEELYITHLRKNI